MGGINHGRFVLGGLAAGVVINVMEALSSLLYAEEMMGAMEAHGLAVGQGPAIMALYLLVGFIAGFVAVWFYTAARARYGPGPRTAVLVGFVYWLGGYLLAVIGYGALGLFPGGMLALWAIVGLVEIVLATLVGGWVYREA